MWLRDAVVTTLALTDVEASVRGISSSGFVSVHRNTLMPHRVPFTIVIGKPMPVPKWTYEKADAGTAQAPPAEMVDEVHKAYMQAVTDLFEQCKQRAGYEGVTLVMR